MHKRVAILTMSGPHHSIIVTVHYEVRQIAPREPKWKIVFQIFSRRQNILSAQIFFRRLTLMNRPTKLMATPLGTLGFRTRRSYSLVLSEVIAAEQRADIGCIGRIVAHSNFG